VLEGDIAAPFTFAVLLYKRSHDFKQKGSFMSTQTERPARKPRSQRGSAARNSRRYSKQTAYVGARRDGKPLIFGWGKHLSHTEKVRIQRRATWGAAGFVVLLLIAVIVGTWINLNIIVPGLAMTTVNGHVITQGEYRQMVAVNTQLELNKLYGPHGLKTQLTDLQKQQAQVSATITQDNTQITNLKNQINKLPAGNSSQRTSLTKQLATAQTKLANDQKQNNSLQNQINNLNNNTIPAEQQNFTQSQIGNESVMWLQDDELLREWLATQSAAVQAKINPSPAQVNRSFNSLKANMPTSNGYNTFLKQMGISDDQIRSMLTILDRRFNAQLYFAKQITSPSYQVEVREIVVQTKAIANTVLQDLQKGQSFATLAKKYSQDTNSNTKGGNLGWLTHYQYIDASGFNGPSVVDNWIFTPGRKVNDLSPVLYGNGSYYIVQVTGISKSKTVSHTLLKALQNNALVDWLQDHGGNGIPLPGQQIKMSPNEQTMLLDSNNLPPNNILPSSAPAATPTTSTGEGEP